MTSPEPKNQEMEMEFDRQELTRKPIGRDHLEKIRNNSKTNTNLYPVVAECLDDSDDTNMDDDTHSVQDGFEDLGTRDYERPDLSNNGIHPTSIQSHGIPRSQPCMGLFAHSNINSQPGPGLQEDATPSSKAGGKNVLRRETPHKELLIQSHGISFSPPLPHSDINSKQRPGFQQVATASSKAGDNKNVRQREAPYKIPKQRRSPTNIPTEPKNKCPSQIFSPTSIPTKASINCIPKSSNIPYYSLYWVLATIFIIIVSILVAGYWKYTTGKERTVSFDYQAIVSDFTDSFKGQPPFSLKVFKSALKSINGTNPSAPAVILFLASKGAEKLARNLGEKLTNSVSPSPVKISGKDLKYVNPDIGKKRIDEALRSINAEYGAVLVENLHLIPGETALMLHSYCDNENAPFKRAVYALIVNMEETILFDSGMKDWDLAVHKRLNRAWRDIDEDQRNPLLSRLTVSVAAILKNDATV